MKFKSLFLFLILMSLSIVGCFNSEKEDNIKIGQGIVLVRQDGGVNILSEENYLSAAFQITGDIEESDIKISDEYIFIKQKESEKINVYIASLNGNEKNIGFYLNNFKKGEIKILETFTKKDMMKNENVKKNLTERLLGDYNNDGEVNILDFNLLKQNFGKQSTVYDIGPATMGKDNWSGIYCYLNGDGRVGIEDLAVFATNFGKKDPNQNKPVEVTSVEITIANTILKIGDSISAYGKVLPSNATDQNLIWSVDNTSILELITVTGGQTASITAKAKGTANLTLTSTNGKTKTINIEVKEPEAKEDLVVYIESDVEPQLYAWIGTAPNETKLLGAWPGKKLTEKLDKFYYYNFGNTYEKINYIHFIGGQSANLSTDVSVWITKDKKIHTVNPYEPSKPIINVGAKEEALNGDTMISVSITANNNTVDNVSINFNGKTVNYTGATLNLKLADYVLEGKSGILEITASNSKGTTTKVMNFTRDDSISSLKLYFETNTIVYAWVVENGAVKNLNGGWPGKLLEQTEVSSGITWYVMDFGMVDSGSYILNGQGGSDQSISSTTWIAKDGQKYNVNPYEPTKPIIAISPESGTYNDSKDKRKITISVTARNATIDTKTATINGKTINLTGETTELDFSDSIANKSTAIIKVIATNSLGTVEKIVEITRDDEYKVPKAEFTWDNAMVYFVLTDRFYNGNPSNDNSYGRQNGFSPDPLDIATFHGGDVAGLTEKIEDGYFDELGVNVIWVTALYEQIHGWVGGGSGDFPHYAYHGYYALDWTMADKNMGTIDEIREFVNTAHEHEIRVVMDVVVNHAGYNSVMDMHDYGFASYDTSVIDNRDWMHPMTASGWQSHHETLVYYKDEQRSAGTSPTPITDWLNWWGPDWVRTGIDGYDSGDGSELENPLCGLPDIKTETTTAVDMAPIMKTKWGMETSGYEDWIVPAASEYRNPNAKIAPADHIIHSLAAWVEEFGIDGFRCDTAKHIELTRWKQLKEEANAALKKWRSKNLNAYGADWDEDFWMVGEWWDFKLGGDNGVYDNGFDAMIDFGFPVKNGSGDLGGTWQSYAGAVNKVMPYLNSHDMGKVGFFGKGANCIPAGTALVLNPGPIQLFYGDENDRPKGPSCTDPDHSIRSDYVWGANPDKLAHWQKLGRFRNMNPAVGAGLQTEIAADTYMREWNTNKVVIRINANGSTEVDVSEAFAEGTNLRNAYNGETAKVTGGKVTFTGENNVILIEEIK